MAFNTANSRQIRANSITNQHIAPNALIDESKLNIDWDARVADIFARKLIVDYVQVEKTSVTSGTSSIVVTSQISVPAAHADEEKGAVVQSNKNKVILRHSVSGEPVISSDGTEVYGKLTHDGTDYKIDFYYKDASGTETTYLFENDATIDFQYPQRFDFNTISENFAANEKFVDGAADVSARLDLKQIANDVFGASYTLNRNGEPARSSSIIESLVEETSGVLNPEVKAKNIIDEVVSARAGYSTLHDRIVNAESNITSNTSNISALQTEIMNAKGSYNTVAERIDALEDALNNDVNNVLQDHESRIQNIEEVSHRHYAEDHYIHAGDSLIATAQYNLQTGTFVPGNKSLQVYYNGFLQMEGVHYTEIVDQTGQGIGVSFSPELLSEGDAIQLRWTK